MIQDNKFTSIENDDIKIIIDSNEHNAYKLIIYGSITAFTTYGELLNVAHTILALDKYLHGDEDSSKLFFSELKGENKAYKEIIERLIK